MVSATIPGELWTAVEELQLVDHHVHGATRQEVDPPTFASLITESDRPSGPGVSQWDSQIGFAIRRWCAPLLGVATYCSPDEYLRRRTELGVEEVNRRFLRACGVNEWLMDTGFNADQVLGLDEMRIATGASCREIVRLEAVAERLAGEGVAAASYADAFAAAVEAASEAGAVGAKTIMAYRSNFDVDLSRPSAAAVAAAAGRWLAEAERTATVRLVDPTLIAFGIWTALRAGLPLQVHVGLGDTDLDLHRVNPLLLTNLFRASESLGTPILLLHCWPYHREAGYLAQMFPHAYFDVGLALNFVGVQSRQIVAESLEVAPFGKQLFSSDGWGPAELHYLGGLLWRRSITSVIGSWVDSGDWSEVDALRVIHMIGADNARRVYRLT